MLICCLIGEMAIKAGRDGGVSVKVTGAMRPEEGVHVVVI